MANSFVRLPLDGTGKQLDTELLTVGAISVHRERNQIAGVGADDIAAVTDTDPSESDHGVAVRLVGVVSPIRDALSSNSLAAGASVNLDGTAIASGKTGKLQAVVVACTAALCRFQIKARDGGVETTIGVCFTSQLGSPSFTWTPPDKRYDVLAYGNGDENFRVSVTNLDSMNAANVYATVYWDEV